MDIINNISRLFTTFNANKLLQVINKYGVIAGGSVVYALNDFVKKKSVGDVYIIKN